jgi:uncharacterized protein (TIGR02453 family)
MSAYFTPATFRFLKDLARHNNRAWFQGNKPRFERDLKQPYLRLVGDLAAPLRKISARYVADPRPIGGSMFRIYRDTRFAKDKKPYKEWAGSQFFHEATRAAPRGDAGSGMGRLDAPVFYLHLQPRGCFLGGGLWHPQPETLKRVRDYLVANPASWRRLRAAKALRRFEFDGESLSRPPRGYDPQHPLIEDLKRKDFVASLAFPDARALRPDFPAFIIAQFKTLAPLVDYLCGALDLEF